MARISASFARINSVIFSANSATRARTSAGGWSPSSEPPSSCGNVAAITWHLDTGDAFGERLRSHFSEPELVELGCMIGLTLGQQSWLRLLNIEHHEVLAGTAASMAPGFENADALKAAKAAADYWAPQPEPGAP